MNPSTSKLRPSDILWIQSSIKNSFNDGRLIGETLDELCNGTCQIQNIMRLRVFRRHHCWWSLDNRRLWVFKEFERLGGCAKIVVRVVDPTNEDLEKNTTTTSGRTIRIRGGDPGGMWHKKPNQTLAKERNRNKQNHLTAKNASDKYLSRKNVTPDGTASYITKSIHKNTEERCSLGERASLIPSAHNNSKRTSSDLDDMERELGVYPHTNNVRLADTSNASTFPVNNTAARPVTVDTRDSLGADTRGRSILSASNSNSTDSADSLRADAFSTAPQTNVLPRASTSQLVSPIGNQRADLYQGSNVVFAAEASGHKQHETRHKKKWGCCVIS